MEILNKYKYPIIGGTIGVFIAICIFSIGFWKMLLMLFLILTGSIIGFLLQRLEFINKINKK